MREQIEQRFVESAKVIHAAGEHLAEPVADAVGIVIEAYRSGRGVFLFGNGGSAADAQHIAGELVGRFLVDRRPLKAVALTTDSSVLTCLANDFSFEEIFARQIEANATAGDVAIGLSTSGNSRNVVAGLAKAREMGLKTIAFTGRDGGKCAKFVDVLLDVPHADTPRVQEATVVVYHVLCELVERVLADEETT